MHGLIVNQLHGYTLARHGRASWTEALRASGVSLLDGRPTIHRVYADEDVVAIVVALAALPRVGMSVPALLEDFGAFLAPTLLRVYEPLLRPEWRTLDVIENVEEQIHTAVRVRDPGAGPPYLSTLRRSPDEVEVSYTSPRALCALAEGIVRGLAAHFGERVTVGQRECMHRGDARCLIHVRREAA